jgi:hypothetical protein
LLGSRRDESFRERVGRQPSQPVASTSARAESGSPVTLHAPIAGRHVIHRASPAGLQAAAGSGRRLRGKFLEVSAHTAARRLERAASLVPGVTAARSQVAAASTTTPGGTQIRGSEVRAARSHGAPWPCGLGAHARGRIGRRATDDGRTDRDSARRAGCQARCTLLLSPVPPGG